jgi:hypothetical protein
VGISLQNIHSHISYFQVLQAQQRSNNNHYTDQSEEDRHAVDDGESDEDENSMSQNGRGNSKRKISLFSEFFKCRIEYE